MTASLKLKLVKVSTGSVGLDNLYFCAFAVFFLWLFPADLHHGGEGLQLCFLR